MEPSRTPTRRQRSRRIAALGLLAAGGLVITALTLSDRVPDLARHGLGTLDPRLRDLVDPIFDAGHFVVWAVMAFVAVWFLDAAAWRLAVLSGLAFTSLGLEWAQRDFSSTRSTSWDDARANFLGIALGAALALVVTTGARAARPSRIP